MFENYIFVDEIATMMDDKGVLMIDIRDRYEYNKSHIANAINIDYDNMSYIISDDYCLKEFLDEVIIYKNKGCIVFYCLYGEGSFEITLKLNKRMHHSIVDANFNNDYLYCNHCGNIGANKYNNKLNMMKIRSLYGGYNFILTRSYKYKNLLTINEL